MKKKVTMTCILRSGKVVTDTVKFKANDHRTIYVIEDIRRNVEKYMSQFRQEAGAITFGKTTISLSEIAAISFKG